MLRATARDLIIAARRRDLKMVRAAARGLLTARDHAQVRTVVVFVGHARSGSTILGTILDAHPDVVVAHEANLLGDHRKGWSRGTLYGSLIERSRWFRAEQDLQWEGYGYEIDRRWQGTYRHLVAIGDKNGHRAATQLGRDPQLLATLQAQVGAAVRVVNSVRNPFDNIATIMRRSAAAEPSRTLDDVIDSYLDRCATIDLVRRSLAEAVLDVHNEDLIASPRTVATSLATHLRVEVDPAWIDAVERSVAATPSRTGAGLAWTDAQRDRLLEAIERFEHLHRYRVQP